MILISGIVIIQWVFLRILLSKINNNSRKIEILQFGAERDYHFSIQTHKRLIAQEMKGPHKKIFHH